jgi:RNA polymerase sigma-70 factor (ECF subfamily)
VGEISRAWAPGDLCRDFSRRASSYPVWTTRRSSTPPKRLLRQLLLSLLIRSDGGGGGGVSGDLQAESSGGPAEYEAEIDAELWQLVGQHADAIYRLALTIVRDRALAEDVVQETLMKAWRALPSLRNQASLRSWLLSIAHNVSVSVLRSSREDVRDPLELPDHQSSGTTEGRAHVRLMVGKLWEGLGELDDKSRAIIVLREVEGLSYQEISTLLELSLPQVKSRLLRARRKLASRLEGWRE